MNRRMGSLGWRTGRTVRRWLALLVLALAGCANNTRPQPESAAADGQPAQRMPSRSSPVSDFRMGSDHIPDVLLRAVADPYRRPAPADCATLTDEIGGLDAVLGPDLDTLPDADKAEGAAGIFGSAVRSLIPYRGVIRLMTGAHQRERRAAAAIAAGGVRRAYLKGLGEQLDCSASARPAQAAPAVPITSPPRGLR